MTQNYDVDLFEVKTPIEPLPTFMPGTSPTWARVNPGTSPLCEHCRLLHRSQKLSRDKMHNSSWIRTDRWGASVTLCSEHGLAQRRCDEVEEMMLRGFLSLREVLLASMKDPDAEDDGENDEAVLLTRYLMWRLGQLDDIERVLDLDMRD